ncbi:MAG: galactose-1-epimerase [Formivibrio sp.]|nr:galactose-1-epimerase [Formivibrio sp.]
MRLASTLCPDGQPVKLITLEHECGTRLSLMDWGGTWLSCLVPTADGMRREVLLGCEQLEDYFSQTAYLGATIGRYANRIGHSRFSRAGRTYVLQANQGPHQLHGGPDSFDRRRWQIIELGNAHVCLGLESPDGDQGFPGNLSAQVCYRLQPDCCISMEYQATVDAPCPVNLTNHAYFNLDGVATDIRQHALQIRAAQYVPVGPGLIPTGELLPVQGTSFDFSHSKSIARDFLADAQQQLSGGYDHAWLLDADCRAMADPAASLVAGDRRLAMDLYTTMPGLQFYSGNFLAGTPARDGGCYAIHQGVALETQFLPDSPNHPEWPQPSCWLMPGETYQYTTSLHFHSD